MELATRTRRLLQQRLEAMQRQNGLLKDILLQQACSNDSFTLRLATLDDVATVVEVVNGGYGEEQAVVKKPGISRTNADAIVTLINTPETDMLCCCLGGAVVGCVTHQANCTEKGGNIVVTRELVGCSSFGMLAVHPEFRRQGVGNLLLGGVQLLARARGSKSIQMSVLSYSDEQQSLVKYYTARGFSVTDTHKPWPAFMLDRLSEAGKAMFFIEMRMPLER
jgi:ribosomal protein S18 acetylase RimI-like enzyme